MAVTKVYNPTTSQWELTSGAVPGQVQSVNGFTGAVLLDAAKVGAADASRVGNLLTEDTASFETTIGNWEAIFGRGTVLTRTTAQASHGLACLSAKVGHATDGFSFASGRSTAAWRKSAQSGMVYTAQIRVRGAAKAGSLRIGVTFYDTGGVDLGGGVVTSWTPFTSTGWTLVSGTTPPAPTNAATVAINSIEGGSASSGAWVLNDILYVDCAGLWAGAGGDWAMPGTPITNLGTKTTHPNVDDVLVQRWDEGLGRWQTIHYDSGVRAISATSLWSGWSGSVYLRRLGSLVTLQGESSGIGNAATTDLPGSSASLIPTGFRTAREVRAIGAWFNSASGDYIARTIVTGGGSIAVARASGTTVTSGTNVLFWVGVSYPTNDAIPTSLPGTLVSAAPA